MCHQNPDGLSRLPTIAHLIPEADRLFSYISDKSGLDLKSSEIQDVVKRLSLDTVLENGILYKIVNKQKRIFVCPSKRTDTIMNAHKLIGHGGTRKTLKQLSLDYYWESMPFDVHETLMACAACQKQNPFDNQVSYKFIKPNYVWHTVSVDVVGPFDSISSGINILL